MNNLATNDYKLDKSVIAVPPLARDLHFNRNASENKKIIRHLELGGVTTLLYGGNAALGHISLTEYETVLSQLNESASSQSVIIPSVGPEYGMMMDQASILRDFSFSSVMLLPMREGFTPEGLSTGIRHFVDRVGFPIILYIKHEEMFEVETVRSMMKDGLISWIKYAIERENPAQDLFLARLADVVGTECIVSGIGEQPALVHMRDFGLSSYTSGCVCIAPALSMAMLRAIKGKDFEKAEQIRRLFEPLELLRETINPVRVLHAAVRLAGIADTGPITPFWSAVPKNEEQVIEQTARKLLNFSSHDMVKVVE